MINILSIDDNNDYIIQVIHHPSRTQYDDWPFYHWICPMLMYIQTIAVFTSAFTLVTISLDRYLAIIYPLRQRTTWRQAVAAIVTVWVASCLVSLPVVINSLIGTRGNGYTCGHASYAFSKRRTLFKTQLNI